MSDIIASFEIDKIGPKGDPGPGVAAGGTAGQVLAKIDSTNYNTHWIVNNVTGAAGGVLAGTYPNPSFDSGALAALGGATSSSVSDLQTIVNNLNFTNIAGQLTDAQLPSDLALSDPGFDAFASFTEGTGLITLSRVALTDSRISAPTTDLSMNSHKITNLTNGSGAQDAAAFGQIPTAFAESVITFTDITTNNSSTSKHGYLKKLDNTVTHFMDGTGNWSTPSAGSGWTSVWITGSNSTTTGQSLVAVTGLTQNLTASTTYEFECMMFGTSSSNPGVEFGINDTVGSGSSVTSVVTANTTSGQASTTGIGTLNNATAALWTSNSGTLTARITGFFIAGTGSPNITIQFLKVTSGTATVNIGSVLRIRVAGT